MTGGALWQHRIVRSVTRWFSWRRIALLRDAPGVLWAASVRFWNNNDLQAAGSLTYTTLLAIVPLFTVTFAIFSAFPAFRRMQDEVQRLIVESLVPTVGSDLILYLDRFVSNAAALTGFGVVFLAVTSILLFFSIESAFNAIWRAVEPRPVLIRLLSFWAVLTMTPLLLGSSLSVSSSVLADLGSGDDTVGGLRLILPGLFEWAAFTLMYLTIPNRDVQWSDALTGGLVAAILMELSKFGFALYISAYPTYETIYGALSVIPIFLVWLYTVWSVVLFGAELTATLPEWRAGKITQVGPEGLLSAQRLVVALAILRELHGAARLGVGIRRATLVNRIPVGAAVLDGMLEQLREAHWVARTGNGAWLATRDLHDTTIHDLRHSLGMSIRGNLRAVGHLKAPWQDRLADIFARAEKTDRTVLGVRLTDLFDGQDEGRSGDPPTP
ncbi:MAG: tRNA-processing ribonuclease [Pseudomonadota bacterium]|jgi:membrane protein